MSKEFKVLIVGGSVAGLTLAHCLERLGISFEVLEQGEDISPQVGASIGILPNGAVILDQLGLFKPVEKAIEPLEFARIRYAGGFFFESQYPAIIRSNFGYPLSFLERQKFLAILYSRLRSKDRVHTGQKVVSVQNGPSEAVVRTAAGREFRGHLVVGADGVHSVVRREIWRQADQAEPGRIADGEKSALRIDYACIFGISSDVPGVKDGIQLSLLDDGLTIHVFNGKDGKAFWFVIVKTDRRHTYDDRPRLDRQDARRICEAIRAKKLDANLTFGDMWATCDIFTIQPLEEGWFKTWHFGRLVCVGDAVRKVTPNIGQGANMAIEDVAALANALAAGDLAKAMADASAVEAMMRPVNASRLTRTARVCTQSEFLTRVQANDGLAMRLVGRYLIPALHDIPAGSSTAILSGTPRLHFADLPVRASRQLSGWTLIRSLRAFAPRPRVLLVSCALVWITWLALVWMRK